MRHRFICLAALFLTLTLGSAGQSGDSKLKIGDGLPPLAGVGLNGERLDSETVVDGRTAVVIFSFSRAGGREAQRWTERLIRDDPRRMICTVIFLESVPGVFRGMAVSGIKAGMPPSQQDRTILMFQDEELWKRMLALAKDRDLCVMLLGPTGRVAWMTREPYTDALYAELSRSMRAFH